MAIFVNGCFWHRCPHCQPKVPKSHPEYWEAKFAANRARDARKADQLEAAGWHVATVWECEVRRQPTEVLAGLDSLLRRDAKS